MTRAENVKTRASPIGRDHLSYPITQDWMHWIKKVAVKKAFSAKELLAEVRKFVLYDPDPHTPEILFWLTKGILAGPKDNYYIVPSRKGIIRAYFFQHPDHRDPRHQPIAPKAKNLTASGLWQGPEKAVAIEIIIEAQGNRWQGPISIVRGQLETGYPMTYQTLLDFLPKKIA